MKTQPVRRRGSRQREAVIHAAKQLKDHPTADMIFLEVRQSNPGVSLSTVYRNLNILVEEGDLIAIKGPGSEVHYDYNVSNHCHIQCRICSKVSDIDFKPVEYISLLPEQTSGFHVDGVSVTFTGICSQCINSKKGVNL